MGNILGQPFAPWVTKQINVRQNSLGTSPNLSNQDLLYQNAKSPWLRLASTVDITLDGENHKKLIANTSIDKSILSPRILFADNSYNECAAITHASMYPIIASFVRRNNILQNKFDHNDSDSVSDSSQITPNSTA